MEEEFEVKTQKWRSGADGAKKKSHYQSKAENSKSNIPLTTSPSTRKLSVCASAWICCSGKCKVANKTSAASSSVSKAAMCSCTCKYKHVKGEILNTHTHTHTKKLNHLRFGMAERFWNLCGQKFGTKNKSIQLHILVKRPLYETARGTWRDGPSIFHGTRDWVQACRPACASSGRNQEKQAFVSQIVSACNELWYVCKPAFELPGLLWLHPGHARWPTRQVRLVFSR